MAALIRAAAARAGPFRYFIVEAPDRFTGVDHVDIGGWLSATVRGKRRREVGWGGQRC
jgi:hypothetical protein